MSQNDFVIANQSGSSFRADVNSALQALATLSSGATAPSTTYAYQLWMDTTTGILKLRNAANTDWVNFTQLLQQGLVVGGTTSGTDTYTLTLTPTLKTLTDGMLLEVTFGNANTVTTPTLNIDSTGAKTIVDASGGALDVGEAEASSRALAMYVAGSNHWRIIANYSRVARLKDKVLVSGIISPTQITADQNNYSPTGLATSNTLRLSSDASRNITGLAGGEKGRVLILHNVGTQAIVLKSESASSTAANRFALASDITISASQAVTLQYDDTSSRWRAAATPAAASGSGNGQCYLDISGGNVRLMPEGGNKIIINGTTETIPDAGVTLAVTGASASTLYYIYAYMNSGTMTLERSTTGWALQAGTGVAVKSGDSTRTLVGMAYTNTVPAWSLVASYYNRKQKAVRTSYTANRSTSSSSWSELNSEIRNGFLKWADEAAIAVGHLSGTPGVTNSAEPYGAISFDGATDTNYGVYLGDVGSGTYPFTKTVVKESPAAEGYHYATVVVSAYSGYSLTLFGNASAAFARTSIITHTRG